MTNPTTAAQVPDVVGIGAVCVDFVQFVRELPERQGRASKVRIERHESRCGGQTAAALATCARLGLRTQLIAALGDDEQGRGAIETLDRAGVDTSRIVKRRVATPYAVILVDAASGERIVLWSRDPGLALRDDELPMAVVTSARLLHVDDVDVAAAIPAARAARAAGLPVTSDIDHVDSRTADLVEAVTVPIFAEHVPASLSGTEDLEIALRRIRQPHHRLVCVTLGPRGAVALEDDRLIRQPGFAVQAVDTTGAGDVFRGGFIYGLLQQWATDRILRFATAAAAVSCTRPGAIDGAPTLEEVERLIAGEPGRRDVDAAGR